MARIENFNDYPQVNLTASVGKGGVNYDDDVLAVQALMKYAFEGERGWEGYKFPTPTGTLCKLTRSLIKRYQRVIKRTVNSATVDGRIDPAKGTFPAGSRAMWTILSLNTDAMATWLLSKRMGANYIHAVGMMFPEFRAAIGDRGVGTLNLELDGGGVGTLGLDLE